MFENKCAVISKKKKKIIMLKKVDLCHFTKDVLYKQLNNKTVTSKLRDCIPKQENCVTHIKFLSFFFLLFFQNKCSPKIAYVFNGFSKRPRCTVMSHFIRLWCPWSEADAMTISQKSENEQTTRTSTNIQKLKQNKKARIFIFCMYTNRNELHHWANSTHQAAVCLYRPRWDAAPAYMHF